MPVIKKYRAGINQALTPATQNSLNLHLGLLELQLNNIINARNWRRMTPPISLLCPLPDFCHSLPLAYKQLIDESLNNIEIQAKKDDTGNHYLQFTLYWDDHSVLASYSEIATALINHVFKLFDLKALKQTPLTAQSGSRISTPSSFYSRQENSPGNIASATPTSKANAPI